MGTITNRRVAVDERVISLAVRIEAVGWALVRAAAPFVVLAALLGLVPLTVVAPAVSIYAWPLGRALLHRGVLSLPSRRS